MSLLTTDLTRKIKSAKPFQKSYAFADIYNKGRYDINKIIHFFKQEGRFSKEVVLQIIQRSMKILQMEPNLLRINEQIWVIGDIHGQLYDFINLCQLKFNLEQDSFLFLGDYVDRGYFSIQVILLLLISKLNRPKKVFLLRGNHESQEMTSYFNFKQQCLKKYDQEIYQMFVDLFNCLPLAALINGTFLCLHGGISSNLVHVNHVLCKTSNISRINRFQQITNSGLLCDLMWADPTLQANGNLKCLQTDNTLRGCSYIFGKQLTDLFLTQNNLQCIIRGHQAQQLGYRLFNWSGESKFPSIITVFSAPNYCDFYNNKGACLKINQKQLNFIQYYQVEHPYTLPDYMDIFQWSVPFVAQKVSQMMFYLLLPNQKIELQQKPDVNFIVKMQIMKNIMNGHKKVAQSNKEYTSLQGRSLDNMLAHDQQAKECIKNNHEANNYEIKRSIDLKYEKRPLLTGSLQL